MSLSPKTMTVIKLLNRLDRAAGGGPLHPDVILRVPSADGVAATRTISSLLGRISDAVASSNENPAIVRRFIAETLSGPAHPTPSTAYKAALDAAKRWFRVVAV